MTRVSKTNTLQSGGYPRIALFIDGQWIHDRPSWSEVRNPSTEAVLGPVPSATPHDLASALAAADRGFRVWRDTSPHARAAIIQAAMRLLRERKEHIARTITLENGKPCTETLSEVERAATFFEWDAAQALRANFGTPGPHHPFGGVKDSGFGREGGESALDAYLVSKTILQSTARI